MKKILTKILAGMLVFSLVVSALVVLQPDKANATSAVQVLVGNSTGSVSTSATQYYDLGFSSKSYSANNTTLHALFPVGGTIGNLYVKTVAAPTATFTITLYNKTSATSVTCAVTGAATTCNDTAHTFSVAAGDYLLWQIVPSGSPTVSVVSVSATFTPTTANDTVLFGTAPALSASVDSFGRFSNSLTAALTNNATTSQALLAEGGTIDKFNVSTNLAPGTGKQYIYTLETGALTTGSATNITCTAADAATTCSDTTNSETPSANYLINVRATPSGTPTSISIGFSARLVPTTAGDFVFMGSTNAANDSATAVRYFPVSGNLPSKSAETDSQQVSNAMTVKAISIQSGAVPTAGHTRVFTLRVNGADTALTCTEGGTDFGCSGTGSVTVNAGDLVDIKDTPSGSGTTPTPHIYSLIASATGGGGGGGTTDTCYYTGSGDWDIKYSDNCYATTTTYVATGKQVRLINNGAGSFNVASGVTINTAAGGTFMQGPLNVSFMATSNGVTFTK